MRASKVDANHKQITEELRGRGCSVTSTAVLKNGEGDLLVGFRGRNYLFEVKDPEQPLSRQRQTEKGLAFARLWRGQRAVVRASAEAWEIIKRDQDGL